MARLQADCDIAARRFIENVLQARTIWYLSDPEGPAFARSYMQNDVPVCPVFSFKEMADRGNKHWNNACQIKQVSLDEFLKTWLPAFAGHGSFIGPDWDTSMAGAEMSASDMIAALSARNSPDWSLPHQ